MFNKVEQSMIEIELTSGIKIPKCTICHNGSEFLLELETDHEIEVNPLGFININQPKISQDVMDTKNNKEDFIPLNDTALEHLQKKAAISEYVIFKPDGSSYTDIRKSWRRVMKNAGLKSYSPHVLRHTFAAMLVREGADLMAVKELGRWSDLRLVERYAHDARDHRTRVTGKLDRKFQGCDEFKDENFENNNSE